MKHDALVYVQLFLSLWHTNSWLDKSDRRRFSEMRNSLDRHL